MRHYLIDTNVLIYARGAAHHYREPCREILRAAAKGTIQIEASVELLREFAHLLLRWQPDRLDALAEIEEARSQVRLHPFDDEVLRDSMDLLRRYPVLGVRDALHAATALGAGLTVIISADRVFDDLAELDRIDPSESAARWSGP